MASVKLKLKMGTIDGEKTFSFPNAKMSPTKAQVKTLAQALITNGSIYKYVPLEARQAWIEVTTENYYDLED